MIGFGYGTYDFLGWLSSERQIALISPNFLQRKRPLKSKGLIKWALYFNI
tara:strand:+ start:3383 stop:3532 length:150 start_codon:yes stop_codon:yes gene_type:complete